MSPISSSFPLNARLVAKHDRRSLYALKDGRLAFVDHATNRVFFDGGRDAGGRTYGSGHNAAWADSRIDSITRAGGSSAFFSFKAAKFGQTAMPVGEPVDEEPMEDTPFNRARRFIPKEFLEWSANYKPGDALPVMPPGYDKADHLDKHPANTDNYAQAGFSVDDVVVASLRAMGMPEVNPELAFMPEPGETETKGLPPLEVKGILGREIRDMARNIADSILTARGLWKDSLNKIRCGSGPNANRFTDIFGTGCDVPGSGVAGNVVGAVRGAVDLPGPADEIFGRVEGTREKLADVVEGSDLAATRGSLRSLLDRASTRARGGDTPHIIGDNPMDDHDPMAGMDRTGARYSDRTKGGGIRALVSRNIRKMRTKREEKRYDDAAQNYAKWQSSDDYRSWVAGLGREPTAPEKLDRFAQWSGLNPSRVARNPDGSPVMIDTGRVDAAGNPIMALKMEGDSSPHSFMGINDIAAGTGGKTMFEALVEQALDPVHGGGRLGMSDREKAKMKKQVEERLEEVVAQMIHAATSKGGPLMIEQVQPDGTVRRVPNPDPEVRARAVTAMPGYLRLKGVEFAGGDLANAVMVTSVNGFVQDPRDFAGGERVPLLDEFGIPRVDSAGMPMYRPLNLSGDLSAQQRGFAMQTGVYPEWLISGDSTPFHFQISIDPHFLTSERYRGEVAREFGAHHLGMEPSSKAFLAHTLDHEFNHVDDFAHRLSQRLGYTSESEFRMRLLDQWDPISQAYMSVRAGNEFVEVPGGIRPTSVRAGTIDLRADAKPGTFLRSQIDELDRILNHPDTTTVTTAVKQQALWMFYMNNLRFDEGIASAYARFSMDQGMNKKTVAERLETIRENLAARGYSEETGVPRMKFWDDMLDTPTGVWNPSTGRFDFSAGPFPANLSGMSPRGQARLDNAASNLIYGYIGGTYAGTHDFEFVAELRTQLNRPGALKDIREMLADTERNPYGVTEEEFFTTLAKFVGQEEVYRLHGRSDLARRFEDVYPTPPPGGGAGGGGSPPTPPRPPGGGLGPGVPSSPRPPRADDPDVPSDAPPAPDGGWLRGSATRTTAPDGGRLRGSATRPPASSPDEPGDPGEPPASPRLRGTATRPTIPMRPSDEDSEAPGDAPEPGAPSRVRGTGVRRPTRPKTDDDRVETTDDDLIEPTIRPETDADRVSPERRRADTARERRRREVMGDDDGDDTPTSVSDLLDEGRMWVGDTRDEKLGRRNTFVVEPARKWYGDDEETFRAIVGPDDLGERQTKLDLERRRDVLRELLADVPAGTRDEEWNQKERMLDLALGEIYAQENTLGLPGPERISYEDAVRKRNAPANEMAERRELFTAEEFDQLAETAVQRIEKGRRGSDLDLTSRETIREIRSGAKKRQWAMRRHAQSKDPQERRGMDILRAAQELTLMNDLGDVDDRLMDEGLKDLSELAELNGTPLYNVGGRSFTLESLLPDWKRDGTGSADLTDAASRLAALNEKGLVFGVFTEEDADDLLTLRGAKPDAPSFSVRDEAELPRQRIGGDGADAGMAGGDRSSRWSVGVGKSRDDAQRRTDDLVDYLAEGDGAYQTPEWSRSQAQAARNQAYKQRQRRDNLIRNLEGIRNGTINLPANRRERSIEDLQIQLADAEAKILQHETAARLLDQHAANIDDRVRVDSLRTQVDSDLGLDNLNPVSSRTFGDVDGILGIDDGMLMDGTFDASAGMASGNRSSSLGRIARGSLRDRAMAKLLDKVLDRTGADEDTRDKVKIGVGLATAFSAGGPAGAATYVAVEAARRGGRDLAEFTIGELLKRGKIDDEQARKAMAAVDRIAPDGLPDDAKRRLGRAFSEAADLFNERINTPENRRRLAEMGENVVDSARQRARDLGGRVRRRRDSDSPFDADPDGLIYEGPRFDDGPNAGMALYRQQNVVTTTNDPPTSMNPGTITRDGGFQANTFDFATYEFDGPDGTERIIFEDPNLVNMDDPSIRVIPRNPYVITGADELSEEGRSLARRYHLAKAGLRERNRLDGVKDHYDVDGYVDSLLYRASMGDPEAEALIAELSDLGEQIREEARARRIAKDLGEAFGEQAQSEIDRSRGAATLKALTPDKLALVHETKYEPRVLPDGTLEIRPLADFPTNPPSEDLDNMDGKPTYPNVNYPRHTVHFGVGGLASGHVQRQSPKDIDPNQRVWVVVTNFSEAMDANPGSVETMLLEDTSLTPRAGEGLRFPPGTFRIVELTGDKKADAATIDGAILEVGGTPLPETMDYSTYGGPARSRRISQMAAELGFPAELDSTHPSSLGHRGSMVMGNFTSRANAYATELPIDEESLSMLSDNSLERMSTSTHTYGGGVVRYVNDGDRSIELFPPDLQERIDQGLISPRDAQRELIGRVEARKAARAQSADGASAGMARGASEEIFLRPDGTFDVGPDTGGRSALRPSLIDDEVAEQAMVQARREVVSEVLDNPFATDGDFGRASQAIDLMEDAIGADAAERLRNRLARAQARRDRNIPQMLPEKKPYMIRPPQLGDDSFGNRGRNDEVARAMSRPDDPRNPPRAATARLARMDTTNSSVARDITYDPQNGDLTVTYNDDRVVTFADVPYERVRRAGFDDLPDDLISELENEQNQMRTRPIGRMSDGNRARRNVSGPRRLLSEGNFRSNERRQPPGAEQFDDGPSAGMGRTYETLVGTHANVVSRKRDEIARAQQTLVGIRTRRNGGLVTREEAVAVAAAFEDLFSGDMRVQNNFEGRLRTELLSNGRTMVRLDAQVNWDEMVQVQDLTSIPITMQIKSADGKTIYGYASRRLEIGEDGIEVHHGSLTITPEFRGMGIASEFNARNENIYKALGVRSITTSGSSSSVTSTNNPFEHQVIGTGATHWARNGFTWRYDYAKQKFIGIIDSALSEKPGIFSDEERQRISSLYKRGRSGEFQTSATAEELVDFEAADRLFAEEGVIIEYRRDLAPAEIAAPKPSRLTRIADRLGRRSRNRRDETDGSSFGPAPWDPDAELEEALDDRRARQIAESLAALERPDWIRDWDPEAEAAETRRARSAAEGPNAAMRGRRGGDAEAGMSGLGLPEGEALGAAMDELKDLKVTPEMIEESRKRRRKRSREALLADPERRETLKRVLGGRDPLNLDTDQIDAPRPILRRTRRGTEGRLRGDLGYEELPDYDPFKEPNGRWTFESDGKTWQWNGSEWIDMTNPQTETSSRLRGTGTRRSGGDAEAGMGGGGTDKPVVRTDGEGRPLTSAASPQRSGTATENYEANVRGIEDDSRLVQSEIDALEAAIAQAEATGEWRGADFGVTFRDVEPEAMPTQAYLTRTAGGTKNPRNLSAEETKQNDAISRAKTRLATAKKEQERLARVATDKRTRREQNVLDLEDIPAEELEQLVAEAEDIKRAVAQRNEARDKLRSDPRFADLDWDQRNVAIDAELDRMGMPDPLSPGAGERAAMHVGTDTLENGVLDPGFTAGDETMADGGGNTGLLNQNQIRNVQRQREETAGKLKAAERIVEELKSGTTTITPRDKTEADLLNGLTSSTKFSAGQSMDLATANPRVDAATLSGRIAELLRASIERDGASLARQDAILKRISESPKFGYVSAYPLRPEGTVTEGYFGRNSGKKVPGNIGTFLTEVERNDRFQRTPDGFVNVKDRPMLYRWQNTIRGTQWLVVGGDDTVVRGFGNSPGDEAQILGINKPVFGFSFGKASAANYRTVLSDIGMALAARAVSLRRSGEEVTPESVMQARRKVESSRIIMLARGGATIDEIAQKTGRSYQFVSELLRLAGVEGGPA